MWKKEIWRKNFHPTWMKNLIEAVHLIAFCIFEYVISAVENYIFSIMYQC